MIHRINRKNFKLYAMDFETHNDEESIQKRETSVWLGCVLDEESKIDDPKSYIYSIEEFVDRLKENSSGYRKHNGKRPILNCCYYDYNLAFEWSFILPELLRRGFKYKENILPDDEYCFNSVSTKSCSSVWLVNLKFDKKDGIIIFKDLAKIFGGGLRKVAKSFNLPTQKGEIDYRKNRLHNYVVTDEEREYCFKDVRIIIDILLIMNEKNDKNFFNVYSMASYACKVMIQTGYKKYWKPYAQFRAEYPVLPKEETDFLRKGVEGGITYAPSRWQYVDVQKEILHIDAHQMHPTQAFKRMFPYGFGTYGKGKPTNFLNKINCCRIKISYSGVLLHSIIKLIGIDFIEDAEIVVWDFEIPTMKKCYIDLQIEYIDYYSYNCKFLPWRKFYSDNYKLRLNAKAKGDAFNTLYYKLLNNSSYGKLLEKPHNEIIMNTINDDGIIDSIVVPKDDEKIDIQAKYTYLPVGSAIPAYSRVQLIETAFILDPTGKNVLYFDTDSIFVIYTDEVKKNWESKRINKQDFLGGWALEEMLQRAEFSAPKRYKTINDEGELSVKMAGINFEKEYYDFDEINIDKDKYIIQRAFRCKGGTIVDVQVKEVNIQKKYEQTYLQNAGTIVK